MAQSGAHLDVTAVHGNQPFVPRCGNAAPVPVSPCPPVLALSVRPVRHPVHLLCRWGCGGAHPGQLLCTCGLVPPTPFTTPFLSTSCLWVPFPAPLPKAGTPLPTRALTSRRIIVLCYRHPWLRTLSHPLPGGLLHPHPDVGVLLPHPLLHLGLQSVSGPRWRSPPAPAAPLRLLSTT